ncbi:glycoside hydrolase family 66 protein [Paludicola sp. MB14-C6]|uniref:glycoside hydrolase family 66 protein n=1 Tax=Paludihabitans sp. MB14-C6 TaxID=3070656 RepID=UPI0027DE063D|nr:glycoside hydrolase family 66 protein [Paludicola sp. MB14-C6]WMJ22508.1 glycoside hydrolase family 66 protein [Paludicola sp. MB14-C6]
MCKKTCALVLSFSLILSLFLSSTTVSALALDGKSVPTSSIATTNVKVINNVSTDKARYEPGSNAVISVDLVNATTTSWNGVITLEITHLNNLVQTLTQSTSIAANQSKSITFTWQLPTNDFTGYLVKASSSADDFSTTAIDCSSNVSRFPRYGYIADFPQGQTQAQSDAMISELTKDYHINAFQFYDWMWRHETLIKRQNGVVSPTWNDLFNRTISWQTILNNISSVHSNNAKAMAYVMSYAAREGYEQYGINPAQGLYSDKSHANQLNVDFGNGQTYLKLFNPKDRLWQNKMVQEYADAINTAGFDGLQMDQMGQRNNVYDYLGRPVYLEDTFSDLVNASKSHLTKNNSQKNAVTFNIVDGTVNGWALNDVAANANTDFSFSEIWWKSNSYNDMKNYIEQVREKTDGKALVLAAYMNYKDNCGLKYEAENAIRYNTNIATNHTGYTGTGFVDSFDTIGDSVSFPITIQEAGNYSFVFRYANSIGSTANRNIYVDGSLIGRVDCKNLPSWDSWAHDASIASYLSVGTHTIKIAYDSNNIGAINLDSLTLGTFDENSVRLANATFAASGASHIELGTGKTHANMLSHEYYPSNGKSMRKSLRDAMSKQYDFITAYENLLYDADINYSDGGLQNISISGEQVTGSGESNKIWYINRQKDDYQILHLINLTGENDTEWRNATNTPVMKNNMAVKYYVGPNANISNVYVASPDYNQCISQELTFTTGVDDKGTYVSFTVPKLEYWDMIYLKRNIQSPSLSIYEAESAVKSGVAVNTNHSGYTGTGFVDCFGENYDTVTFTVNALKDADYSLKFRYANASGGEATRAILVDGKFINKAYFKSLANWDTWGYAELGVALTKGPHTIVVLYDQYQTGPINLDHMLLNVKEESARSLYLNNWKDTVAIWQDTFTNQNTPLNGSGPGLYELRYFDGNVNSNYNVNNIKNYSSFLRDQASSVAYTTGTKFASSGYFNGDGILVNEYNTYDNNSLPVKMTRNFAFVPEKNFIIVKYDFTNPSTSQKAVKVLDMLHPNNKMTSQNISANYNPITKTTIINMSNSQQPYLAHGILDATGSFSYQVANDTISNLNNQACSPWHTFNNNGTIQNNSSVTCADISTAYAKELSLPAGSTQSVYFYVAIAKDNSAINATINEAIAHDGAYWMQYTASKYHDWLNSGKHTNYEEKSLNDAYNNILVTTKQSTVPGDITINGTTKSKFAACPATTNPSAYSYKVWARDSAVTAMSLDATGHLKEAGNYWTWLADRQIKTDEGSWKKPGTFWTCYSIWDNSPISFVEPEYDSIGMFLVGAYKHYEFLPTNEKAEFLNKIWPSYKLSADYVLNNITSAGFGPADCSIWEEQSEFNSFTQALYVAGLDAAQYMASAMGRQDIADMYNGGASAMRTAIQRDDTAYPKGLWNVAEQYFNRAVSLNGNANTIHDSSSNVLIPYGVIDATSSRAKSHIDKTLAALAHDTYGIARYENDGFYHRMPWDPGGNEALEDEPSWPQMAMWVAMYEIQSGYQSYKANAYERLKWFVSRTAKGYMPQGECCSNITLKPLVSTMCEPITGAAYLMTALAYENQFDMRVFSPQANAGANKNITIVNGCAGDWEQWSNIPYYVDRTGDAALSDKNYDMERVYLANDSDNLYCRIDTVGRNLPGYQSSDKFAVQVYSEDFASTANSTNTGIYGNGFTHNMSYMLTRSNQNSDYKKYSVSNNTWIQQANVANIIAPQWETNSGRIEMAIPFSALSSTGAVGDNNWANLVIVLTKETSPGVWTQMDTLAIHYRKTGSGIEWIKGNFE